MTLATFCNQSVTCPHLPISFSTQDEESLRRKHKESCGISTCCSIVFTSVSVSLEKHVHPLVLVISSHSSTECSSSVDVSLCSQNHLSGCHSHHQGWADFCHSHALLFVGATSNGPHQYIWGAREDDREGNTERGSSGVRIGQTMEEL